MPFSKEEILKEIRKVAELNNREMVGRRKFESLSGIKEKDWKGKFWINWSDAVVEAGYKPGIFTKALDENILLKRLAELILELDHFPQIAEFRMKRNTDSSFPYEKTYNRFGNKAFKAKAVYEWCLDKSQYQRVLEITRPLYLEALKDSNNNEIKHSESTSINGFVYLMKSGKYYKIGKTNSLDRRQYEIGLQLPEGIVPIHSIETDDPSGIEAYWHNRFKGKRLKGEWFELSKLDISIFKKRKFM